MDLQVKSWLEKAKRLNFSVWVMLRSDSSDEFGESAELHVLICKNENFNNSAKFWPIEMNKGLK